VPTQLLGVLAGEDLLKHLVVLESVIFFFLGTQSARLLIVPCMGKPLL